MTNSSPSKKLARAMKHVAWLCMLIISSCSHRPVTPTYSGKLSYPVTEHVLNHGLKLTHVAGAPCLDESRPEVGTSDGTRTYSIYQLSDDSGKKLCECPSGLSDPKFAGEFEAYYRENDEISVRQSDTGNTVLITEDRSPAFPRIALLLLSKDDHDVWHAKELLAPHIRGSPPNIYGYYASVINITDSDIRFSAGKKQWSETFTKVTKPAETNQKPAKL